MRARTPPGIPAAAIDVTRAARSEPISRVDTAWLRMEQPTNRMMITGVIVFSGALDFERLLETIERRFLVFARFRQKAVDGPGGARWEEDLDFDLRAHVRREGLPGAAGRAELEAFVSRLASTPLDHARPLWQFHLVENYVDGPALVVRIHHAIADGIALVQVFLSLTDTSAGERPSARDPETWKSRRVRESRVFERLAGPARGGLDFVAGLARRLLEEGSEVARDPARAAAYLGDAVEIAGELGQALALPNDPRSPLKGHLGPAKQVAWTEPLPLEEVKAVARAFACTVNDVLIAAVSGALRNYLLARAAPGEELADLRATVPVNLRPLEHALELGNHFGLVFLQLPLSEAQPLRRLHRVTERMNRLKASRQAAVTFGLLSLMGMAPQGLQQPALDVLSEKASAVLTNVPGPQQPLYLAGAQLAELMFWVPQNGSISTGISILSYDGKVFFGVITDRGLVPDPARIIGRFRQEFENLLYLALMQPPGSQGEAGWAERLLEDGQAGGPPRPG